MKNSKINECEKGNGRPLNARARPLPFQTVFGRGCVKMKIKITIQLIWKSLEWSASLCLTLSRTSVRFSLRKIFILILWASECVIYFQLSSDAFHRFLARPHITCTTPDAELWSYNFATLFCCRQSAAARKKFSEQNLFVAFFYCVRYCVTLQGENVVGS